MSYSANVIIENHLPGKCRQIGDMIESID